MIRVLLVWLLLAGPGAAQELSGLARLDAGRSGVEETADGLAVTLHLSQPVPWRVFTLDAPRRLVLDFRALDWRGADPAALKSTDAVTRVRFDAPGPGWSRLVLDLGGPYRVETAEMAVDAVTGTATVRVHAAPTDAATFADRAGGPETAPGRAPDAADAGQGRQAGPLVVAVDPGHGGVDPGAARGGVEEADLMLRLGLELAEAVARAGMIPVLTRSDDSFVSLADRLTIARNARADVFLSLHADALEGAEAQGASVYLLSREGQDQASARMVERHEREDLLAGLDLTGEEDAIATVLMDLARLETAPRSDRLADAIVSGLREAGARLNSRPRRAALLAVLLSADMPSVLIETGFLSNARDRAALTSAEGRAPIVAGIVAGLGAWTIEDAALRGLRRQ